MPFDAGGTFTRSYNWQADRDAGVKILAQRMDGEFNNYAGGLNQTFLRTGIVPMGGPLNMNSNPIVGVAGGTLTTPGLRFESDTDTGIMQSGPGNLTLVVDGVAMMTATVAGGIVLGGGITLKPGTAMKFADGTAAAPGISFAADPATGIFRSTAPGVNIAVAGVTTVNSTGAALTVNTPMSLNGNLNITGRLDVTGALAAASLNISGGITATGLTINGGAIVTGNIASAAHSIGDANFSLGLGGPNPLITFDVGGDFLAYIRATNVYQFTINAQAPLTISAGGVTIPGTVAIGDTNHVIQLNTGRPFWLVDTNDYWIYDRTTNVMTFTIAGTSQFSVSPTQSTVNGNLITIGNITAGYVATSGGGGSGYTSINNGTTSASGLIAFYRPDGNRHGYIGFASNPAGSITYANDQNGGHSFTGGNVAVPTLVASGNIMASNYVYPGNDANYYIGMQSPNVPLINFDGGDYIVYDRSSNAYNFLIGGTLVHAVNAAATLVPSGGAGGGLTEVGYKYHDAVVFSGNGTIGLSHLDRLLVFTGGAGQTVTLSQNMPNGASFDIINMGSGTLTIAGAGGVSLYWQGIGGALQTGNRILSNVAFVKYTLTCVSNTSWVLSPGGAPQIGVT